MSSRDADPQREAETVAREALAEWGLPRASSLELLKLRENAVFAVREPTGGKYAMRLHRPGYHSDSALASELQWILALKCQGFPVAPIIRTVDGRPFAHVKADATDRVYQCDLLGWVQGQPIGHSESRRSLEPEEVARTYRTLGALAARLHTLGSQWQPPLGFTRHSWDESGCIGTQALWGDYNELSSLALVQLELLNAAASIAIKDLEAFGKGSDRFGLIHADLIPENVLRDGERLTVIDFDDAGFGWYIWEIVTAVFFLQDTPAYHPALQSMIEGYRQVRHLSETDLSIFPTLMLVRGLVYLGWFHTRRETHTAREMTAPITELTLSLAEQLVSRAG